MAGLPGHEWLTGFAKSWGLILASEIGDKTFIIAAVMAMKNSRRWVFAGAIGALALMTLLSAMMGWAAPNLLSKTYTHYAATILFFVFGGRLLYDSLMNRVEDVSEEFKEIEREISRSDSRQSQDGGAAKGQRGGAPRLLSHFLPAVFAKVFTLTFLAEWGDRSQIATIGLAVDYDVLGVTLGGVLGHCMCTGAAVLGGRHLASHINERLVSVFGGVLFLAFGVHSMLEST